MALRNQSRDWEGCLKELLVRMTQECQRENLRNEDRNVFQAKGRRSIRDTRNAE